MILINANDEFEVSMTTEEYTKFVESTRNYKSKEEDFYERLTGLAAEAGEVSGIYQKAIRDKTEVFRDDLVSELGDVLYYLTALASINNIDLNELMVTNKEKLVKRGYGKK